MSIAFLLTTPVVVATPVTSAVYAIGPGPVPWLQGRHRRRVRRHPRRRRAPTGSPCIASSSARQTSSGAFADRGDRGRALPAAQTHVLAVPGANRTAAAPGPLRVLSQSQ
jgi:hypothetical protein